MPVRWLKAQPDRLEKEASLHGSREFLHAVIAGCALVAAADGVILSVERKRLYQIVQDTRALSVFDPKDVEEAFTAIAGRLECDYVGGRNEALQIVARLRGQDRAARLCMRACCTIAAADGLFDENETRSVAEICQALGLDPESFEI